MDVEESVPISIVAQPHASPQVTISTQTPSESIGSNTDSPPKKSSKMVAHDQGNQANLSYGSLPSCSTCGKVFKNFSQLSQHMLVHSNKRKYKCSYCEKAFKQMSHVQQHTRMHTGEKPYKCKVEGCDKGFAQMANLHHHMRCHEKDPDYQKTGCVSRTDSSEWHHCDECDNQFKTSRGLACHKQKAHTKYDPSKAGTTPSPVKVKRKRGASPKGGATSSYQDQHNEVSSSTSTVGNDSYSSPMKTDPAISTMYIKHEEGTSQTYTAVSSNEATISSMQGNNQGTISSMQGNNQGSISSMQGNNQGTISSMHGNNQSLKLPAIAHISPPRVSTELPHIPASDVISALQQ